MDFSNCKNYNKNINMPIVGEMEFYYNRWIITDKDDKDLDSYIKAPSKWSNLTNNKTVYNRVGYASYKVTLTNLEPNSKIKIKCNSLTLSVNLYLNGAKAGYCGMPSKEKYDKVSDLNEADSWFVDVPTDGSVEVVLETGLSKYGGLVAMPYIVLEDHSNTYMSFINFLPAVALGLLFFSIVMSLFMSFSLKRGEGKYYLFFTFLSIAIHFIFSYDILLRTRGFNFFAKDMIFEGCSFLSICIFSVVQLLYLTNLKKISMKKIYVFFSVGILLFIPILYFVFLATIGSLILWLCFYLLQLPIIIKCLRSLLKKSDTEFFIYIYFIMIGISLMEMMDAMDLITLTTYGHTSAYMLAIMFLTFGFYAHRLIHLNRIEKRSKDMEIEALKLKNEILLNQIKPHFVYNTLATIQGLYHKNILEGDEGIVLFSKYLRTNVDAIEEGIVSFSEELDNIINYVNLVNLSVEPAFVLEVEIDYEDFMLPVLSLQPIIENAIKYSRVNEKKDGYIKIKSYCIENEVTVILSNNGVPFDVTNISSASQGLKNSRIRLENFLNATFEMSSDIEETKIEIHFTLDKD
ncbi:MAG: histidine kinase [Anaeroplasma bactoclasticum]|nr:histidine kinase [Anaeroplasma bactoclasticum]